MEKEIEINGRKIIIKEITYLDSIEVGELREKEGEGLKSAISKQLLLSTNLSDEEIKNLTLHEGAIIQKAVNEINAIDALDFQKPTEENKN